MRVLVTGLLMVKEADRFRPLFEAAGIEVEFRSSGQFLTQEELLPILHEFDGMVAGDDELTAKVLQSAAPRLKVISKWGVGLDAVDLDAAQRLGIAVFNTPGAFSEAVAEVALGYVLILTRHLLAIDRQVRDGGWPKPVGLGLAGRSLGIIGYGGIGQAIARRAVGFGLDILAYDVRPIEGDVAARQVDLDTLLRQSQIVCLACSLTPDNLGMINPSTLQRMPRGAYLINVARGPLVDLEALVDNLRRGHLAGAGLDVYDTEPLPQDHPLTTFDNVVLGSHNANNLGSANEAVHRNTLSNLFRSLGLAPPALPLS